MKFTAAPVLALASCLAFGSIASAQDRNLNIYNWDDYIDPAVLEAFEQETGISITYDTVDSDRVMETKVMAGRSGYDIINPSSTGTQRLIEAGVLQKLDQSQLPNAKHLWPVINNLIARFDPDNLYLAPYNWWTVGIVYNVDMVEERLGGDVPLTWDLLFDPVIAAKLEDCGIVLIDSPTDVLRSAMIDMGLDPYTTDAGLLEKAADHVMAMRPYVRQISNGIVISAMANGDACISTTWSGDALIAKERAIEAENGVELRYFLPEEGAQLDFDGFAILDDAPNVEEAHEFLNFMMRPDIAAQNANYIRYGSANLTAQQGIDKILLDDPGVYPTDAVLANLSTPILYDAKTERTVTRLWTRVRTGD